MMTSETGIGDVVPVMTKLLAYGEPYLFIQLPDFVCREACHSCRIVSPFAAELSRLNRTFHFVTSPFYPLFCIAVMGKGVPEGMKPLGRADVLVDAAHDVVGEVPELAVIHVRGCQ